MEEILSLQFSGSERILNGEHYLQLLSCTSIYSWPVSILVLDELDSFSASSHAALQPLFSLATEHPSALRIIGIANTHTLTSASSLLLFSANESSSPSRSKQASEIKTIHFAPYDAKELLAILTKRLEKLPQDELKSLLPMPALMLLTKKVSSLTGDVRVLFEVLRGALDLAVTTPSDSSKAGSNTPSESVPRTSVTPAHILSALKSYTPASTSKAKAGATGSSNVPAANSEIATKVRNLNLQARLVLLSLVLASKRITLSLSLSSSTSSNSNRAPASPTKCSPMKRTTSTASAVFGASDAPTSGIDSTQLHAYYSSVLNSTDAFSPVSRPDFTDILGVLETTGLLSVSTSSARSFKRSSSFTSIAGKGKGSPGTGSQIVSLQGNVREAEVARGLGIGAEAATSGDALEDEVRSIWAREFSKIRKSVKANDSRAETNSIAGFEDAMED